nr:D-aminoacyl-tRNA deacylase [Candidatus Prometheoarchaeum syntrophicum]
MPLNDQILRVTIITSTEDIASQTIRSKLLELYPFKLQKDLGKWNKNTFNSVFKYIHTNPDFPSIEFSLIDTDISMIRLDDYLSPDDMFGDLIIFASRHQSKSERTALLCHTPGNLNEDNSAGGEPFKIAKGSGLLSYYCYSHLVDLVQKEEHYDVPVNHEVTHHGPTKFIQPSIFIELGSTEVGWKNETGGKIIAHAIFSTCCNLSQKHYRAGKWHKHDIRVGIGFGGGHYMPSFSSCIENMIGFAHTVSKHKVFDLTIKMIQQILDRTLETIDYWVIDWKGLKSAERLHVLSLLKNFDSIPYKKSKELRQN